MTNSLQPYPEYKDSGVPWFGAIPKHWELLRLGALLRERGETNDRLSVDQVLSVLRGIGVIPYEEKGHIGNKRSEDIRRYKIVRPNDIVVNCMNVIIGSVGLSRYTGCLSPVYYVLTARSEEDDPRYLNYIFQTKLFQRSLVRIGNGILAHRMRIPMELLKCELLPRPPKDEQSAIVRYLDHANRSIDRYIRAKRKLIALLNEQKQVIIQQAVTRGLDPNVRLKPSGVEWLGDVPEHWEVMPLKHAFQAIDYGISESSTDSGSIRVLTMGDIQNSAVIVPDHGGVDVVDRRLLLRDGDLLFNRTNSAELVGKVGLFRGHTSCEVTFASYLVRLRPKQDSCSVFLNYLLNSSTILGVSRRFAIPSLHQSNLNPTRYSRIQIAVPPHHEQQEIAEYLDDVTQRLNAAIDREQCEIDLIREYRTRLIADVVTGKIDVREAAQQLPGLEDFEAAVELDSETESDYDQGDEDLDALEPEEAIA